MDSPLLLSGAATRPEAAERDDDGTNDLVVSQVVRMNELQSWFVQEHLGAQADSAG